MTPKEFAEKQHLRIAVEGSGEKRKIDGAFCGDLLSLASNRIKSSNAFITTMADIHTIAVGVLADASCIILCEGLKFDKPSRVQAAKNGLCVLEATQSVFEVSLLLGKELNMIK